MATISEGVHSFDAKYLGHDQHNVDVFVPTANDGKGKKMKIPVDFDLEKSYLKKEIPVGTMITVKMRQSIATKMKIL